MTSGNLSEGSGQNIFVVRDGVLQLLHFVQFGIPGALAAGVLFVLPGAAVVLEGQIDLITAFEAGVHSVKRVPATTVAP